MKPVIPAKAGIQRRKLFDQNTLRTVDPPDHTLDSRRHGNDNVALFLSLDTYGTASLEAVAQRLGHVAYWP